jgi:hypothetical protein
MHAMPRGVTGSTCSHPASAKREYRHPAGHVELRCRICHNLHCAAMRAMRKNPSYYKHYDVRVYLELARLPWRKT